MPKRPMKVYLTTQQHHLLTKIAEKEETSRSEVLRNAFRMYAWVKVGASERLKRENWMSEQ